METIKELIILGGGTSIREGISLGLKEQLEGRFVIAVNYACLHFPHTFMTCCDSDFYFPTNIEQHPNIYEHLKKEGLIITTANLSKNLILPNTLFVRGCGHKTINGVSPIPYEHWGKESLTKGFYTPINTGIFSLTLGLYLMDFKGIVYLLGFDWTCGESPTDKVETHYYKDVKHRGVGYTIFHGRNNPDKYYSAFQKERDTIIYNVSLKSKIETFPKITYQEMFQKLSPNKYNQEDLRNLIKTKLKY